MLFQRKIDGAMKKLHEGSDAAEEERRKEAGEPYEEMERPELEKGDIPAMIIAAFITFIPVASAWNYSCGRIFPVTLTGRRPPAQTKITVLKPGGSLKGERKLLFGDSEQKKKQKEQRSREKEWKGKLTGAGMEKGAAGELAKIITEAQRSGESLQEDYKTSREHLERAQRKIELLLDEMTEEPERDVKKSLDSLIVDLDHVYHICSIREDDPDYGSTVKCLKTASSELGMPDAKISTLMLRSELENIQAVLKDAAAWEAPDFFALAFYLIREEKDTLADMENGQRNQFLSDYLKENFKDRYADSIEAAGLKEDMDVFIRMIHAIHN